MSDTATLLLVLLLVLLIVGALRLDSLSQLWREWLHLGEQPGSQTTQAQQDPHAHGPYGLARLRRLQAQDPAHARPAFHRRGRRG